MADTTLETETDYLGHIVTIPRKRTWLRDSALISADLEYQRGRRLCYEAHGRYWRRNYDGAEATALAAVNESIAYQEQLAQTFGETRAYLHPFNMGRRAMMHAIIVRANRERRAKSAEYNSR